MDEGVTGFVGVKGHEGSVTIATTIPLGAPTGLAKTLHLLSAATMLTDDCF